MCSSRIGVIGPGGWVGFREWEGWFGCQCTLANRLSKGLGCWISGMPLPRANNHACMKVLAKRKFSDEKRRSRIVNDCHFHPQFGVQRWIPTPTPKKVVMVGMGPGGRLPGSDGDCPDVSNKRRIPSFSAKSHVGRHRGEVHLSLRSSWQNRIVGEGHTGGGGYNACTQLTGVWHSIHYVSTTPWGGGVGGTWVTSLQKIFDCCIDDCGGRRTRRVS